VGTPTRLAPVDEEYDGFEYAALPVFCRIFHQMNEWRTRRDERTEISLVGPARQLSALLKLSKLNFHHTVA
jgi:hypothetical protein